MPRGKRNPKPDATLVTPIEATPIEPKAEKPKKVVEKPKKVLEKITITEDDVLLLKVYKAAYKENSAENIRKAFNQHNKMFPDNAEAKIFCQGCVFRVFQRMRNHFNSKKMDHNTNA